MNKNKKLVALICAMAMILSLFTSFTIVNAAGEGMALEYNAAESTATVAVVNVKATGYTEVNTYTINFAMPAGADVESTKAIFNVIEGGQQKVTAEQYGYSCADASKHAVPADGIIAKIAVAVPEGYEAFDVQLSNKSAISDGTTTVSIPRGTLPEAKVTVPAYTGPVATEDPNATAAPTPYTQRGDKPVTPTADPTAPTKEPVTVTTGMELVYNSAKSTATTAVIDVVAKGYTEVNTYTINFPMPAGADVANTKAVFNVIEGGQQKVTAEQYGYSCADASKHAVPADGIISSISIALPEGYAAFDVQLSNKSAISDGTTTVSIPRGTLPEAWVTVPAYTSDEPAATDAPVVGDVVKASDAVDPATADGEKIDSEGDSDYRLAVKVTKDDGSDAVYGTDYVAAIQQPDGTYKNLTPTEYQALKDGYVSLIDGVDSVKDAISKLVFKPYNSGLTFDVQTINAQDKVVAQGEVNTTPATPTAEPAVPVLTVTANPTSVNVKDFFTVTAVVPDDMYDADAVFTYTIDNADYVTQTSVLTSADKKTQTATYLAGKKGTVKVTVQYVKGTEVLGQGTATVKIATASSGGGSSSSSSSSSSTASGTGIIANGNNTGTITPIGAASFTDLETVPWAQAAINDLAARGVINGRDEFTFDPNANITRAEYAQILVGALGRTADSADTYFDDVPTNAWFYHSVAVAAQLGIIEGYGDGNFGPNDLITREQMALMTQKAAVVAGKNLAAQSSVTFADDANIADWASNAVYTLANAGIINGMGDGTFAPKANATRAQAAVIVEAAIY